MARNGLTYLKNPAVHIWNDRYIRQERHFLSVLVFVTSRAVPGCGIDQGNHRIPMDMRLISDTSHSTCTCRKVRRLKKQQHHKERVHRYTRTRKYVQFVSLSRTFACTRGVAFTGRKVLCSQVPTAPPPDLHFPSPTAPAMPVFLRLSRAEPGNGGRYLVTLDFILLLFYCSHFVRIYPMIYWGSLGRGTLGKTYLEATEEGPGGSVIFINAVKNFISRYAKEWGWRQVTNLPGFNKKKLDAVVWSGLKVLGSNLRNLLDAFLPNTLIIESMIPENTFSDIFLGVYARVVLPLNIKLQFIEWFPVILR